MAPKRRGRPRKTEKPVDDIAEKQETSASADAKEEVVEEEEEEEEKEKAETEPSPKKIKVEEKKKRGRKPKATSKKAAAASKKAVDDDEKEDVEEDEEGVEEEVPADAKSETVVIIEASKECNCFKTRAAKVQTGLTKAIPGIEVLINPDKPRKGCFEVRGKDGNVYMSLLGLPRPFTKLKNLDMDKAVEEIVAKVK